MSTNILGVVGDTGLEAIVNPTRRKVIACVDVNGIFRHTFAPGEINDKKTMCIKLVPKDRASYFIKSRGKFLRSMPVDAARMLYDEAVKLGDFHEAWKKVFGSVPAVPEAVENADAMKERMNLMATLQEHQIPAEEMPIEDMRRYAARPDLYFAERIRERLGGATADSKPSEIARQLVDEPMQRRVEEPDQEAVELRSQLRSLGASVPPRAGKAWMRSKLDELSAVVE
jgi:hypothetical protein